MIRAEIKAKTLRDYYRKLVAAQQVAHGVQYCAHHGPIRRLGERGLVYAELGINQGATLAAALLAGFSEVIGVDHRLAPYQEHESLFKAHAQEQNQILSTRETDSRRPLGPVDFLLIDSAHNAGHLRQELAAHAADVRRHILVHDTSAHPALYDVLLKLEGWTMIDRMLENVGYTLMERGTCTV